MPKFSFIEPQVSSDVSNIFELLSVQGYNKVAAGVNVAFDARERLYNHRLYCLSTITYFNKDTDVLRNTLAKMHNNYRSNPMLSAEAADIADKCIHNQLVKDRNRMIVEKLASYAFGFVNKAIEKCVKRAMKKCDIKRLMKLLGIKDMVLIDGTEIEACKRAVEELGIKPKGRKPKGKEASTAKPCFKLHIAYSVLKQSFEYVEITGGVDSERDRVYFNKFKDTLFVMDAGYCGNELEELIVKSGNYFLVKGKCSMAGSVSRATAVPLKPGTWSTWARRSRRCPPKSY